jgi:hypothetical protein
MGADYSNGPRRTGALHWPAETLPATVEPMDLEDRCGLAPGVRATLAAIVAGHRTLEEVVRWGLAHSPPLQVAEVVVQDEFTHDVVMPWGELFLVYDTT